MGWYVGTNPFVSRDRSGRSVSDADFVSRRQFVFLTYILGVAWLGVFGFSAVPVFLFYNMWSTCATMRSPVANITNIDSICVDVRQYGRTPKRQPRQLAFAFGKRSHVGISPVPAAGIIPWNATPGKACGSMLSDICNTSEVRARL